jgi:ribosomal protein S18 acetylase RimI-like enzyme
VVEEVVSVTGEVVEALQRLVPQLSATAPSPEAETIRRIVESETTTLLVYRDDAGRIVGTLTLARFTTPTGRRAWLEDLIVEPDARGQGIGEALTREALRVAAENGARTVDLTSRPSREAANHLYRRLGFVERETNVYRLTAGTPT